MKGEFQPFLKLVQKHRLDSDVSYAYGYKVEEGEVYPILHWTDNQGEDFCFLHEGYRDHFHLEDGLVVHLSVESGSIVLNTSMEE